MPVVTRHETNIVELQALLDDLETLPCVGMWGGVYRTVNNVRKGSYVSRAEIVTTCEALQTATANVPMTKNGMKAFEEFMTKLKDNTFKTLEKGRYVTVLAAKWMVLKPFLTAYAADMSKNRADTASARGLIAELQ